MNFSMATDGGLAPTSIKVIGVGGGGGNAVNRMIRSGMRNVEFIAMNTDSQVLSASLADKKMNIGFRLTKGFGAGGDALIGQRAAEESREEIQAALKGADMVFITAGMGGGTGTGAAPVVAEIAKSMGILTVAVVTKPFAFEQQRRMRAAEMGVSSLSEKVDAIIVVPNERLKYISTEKITLANAFAAADSVLSQGVQSIADIISGSGFINLDFADVTSIMKDAGNAHMGVGRAAGKDKARIAAEAAINSPLLETKIDGATGVIVSIIASPDALLDDISLASEVVSDLVDVDAQLIWGVSFDENLDDEMIVTVIATGFENDPKQQYIKEITGYKNKQQPAPAAAPVAPAAPVAAPAPEPAPQPVPVAEPVFEQTIQQAIETNPVLAQLEQQTELFNEQPSEPEEEDWLQPLDFGKAERRKAELAAAKTAAADDFGFTPKSSTTFAEEKSFDFEEKPASAPKKEKKVDEWPDLEPITPVKKSEKSRKSYDYDEDDDDYTVGGIFGGLFGGGKNKKKKKR
ncbi:MAG: cell division protein FtsZ [Oscillospiraceae bacterium]|nr:cell division protein FtsZ [Oscillospiraceae bacterium]